MKKLIALCLSGLILTGCASYGQLLPQEEPEWELMEEAVATFSDGEQAGRWIHTYSWGRDIARNYYRISDGTVLVREDVCNGPENVYVMNHESYHDLSGQAQAAVSAYFEEQGLLYDLPSLLNTAYERFLACKERGEDFSPLYAGQSVTPSASNERIMCFLTDWSVPLEGGEGSTHMYLGAVFDRETGESIAAWDLFSVSEAKARAAVLDAICVEQAAGLREELEAALRPEYLIWHDTALSVHFPAGSLPSQKYSSGFSVSYRELETVLHDWAIPVPLA